MVAQKKGQTVHADPWLVAFANIGFDDGQPRPPVVKAKHSRFLGLDARRKGYILDPDREYEVIEGAGVLGLDLVKQTYRGVTKHWTRLKQDPDVMIPWLDQRKAPLTWGHVLGFTQEFPSRSIMSGGDCWPLWRMVQREKGGREIDGVVPLTPESSAALKLWLDKRDTETHVRHLDPEFEEIILSSWGYTRRAVRMFLESVYTLGVGQDDGVTGWVNLLHANIAGTIGGIATECLGSTRTSLGRAGMSGMDFDWPFPDGDIEPTIKEVEQHIFNDAYWRIYNNRAPIWMNVTSDLETQYVSDALPGIAWAESMNFFYDRPAWGLLRMCGWCGRFFTSPPGERRRPREFCTDPCRKRFHDYGPHDRRKARITQ